MDDRRLIGWTAPFLGLLCAVALACAGATPSPAAVTCAERYAACATLSTAMPEYVACRQAVDSDCLAGGAAADAAIARKDGSQ